MKLSIRQAKRVYEPKSSTWVGHNFFNIDITHIFSDAPVSINGTHASALNHIYFKDLDDNTVILSCAFSNQGFTEELEIALIEEYIKGEIPKNVFLEVEEDG